TKHQASSLSSPALRRTHQPGERNVRSLSPWRGAPDLSILKHLESPAAHRLSLPGKSPEDSGDSVNPRRPGIPRTCTYIPKSGCTLYAENQVAPLRRKMTPGKRLMRYLVLFPAAGRIRRWPTPQRIPIGRDDLLRAAPASLQI